MWILLALLTAVCTALRDAASKHATREAEPLVVAFVISAVPALVLGSIVGLQGATAPHADFWIALAVSGGINALATPLIVWALQQSDLSLVAPLRSLTPLFMLPVAALVLGEEPSTAGAAGVGVIVLGAYLLNVSDRRAGPVEPLRALARDPGARAMLAVAFLYAISASYDKVGTQASSPLFWAAAVQGTVAALLAPLALLRRGRRSDRARGESRGARGGPPRRSLRPDVAVLLAGLLAAVAAAAQMTALTLTLAAYVIAVKRTSTLFAVALGRSLFREENTGERLLGAVVMLAGFLVLTLS